MRLNTPVVTLAGRFSRKHEVEVWDAGRFVPAIATSKVLAVAFATVNVPLYPFGSDAFGVNKLPAENATVTALPFTRPCPVNVIVAVPVVAVALVNTYVAVWVCVNWFACGILANAPVASFHCSRQRASPVVS